MRQNSDELIRRAFDLGVVYEQSVTGCCQCTIAAIQDALDIRNDAVFMAGSGLTAGGGVSCQGSCGGYTGGVMVMSSMFGRRRTAWREDTKAKDCAHRMALGLLKRFEHEYGSHICHRIHRKIFGRTFDLKNPRERSDFEALGAHRDKCTAVVGLAAAWAVELILEEMKRRGMSRLCTG